MLLVAPSLLAPACAPQRDCGAEIWHIGEAARVSVVGEFNGWNPEADPLEEVRPGAWLRRLELPAGDYRYMLSVDGAEVDDPLAPLLSWDPVEQRETALLRVADCAAPALEIGGLEIRGAEPGAAEGGLSLTARFLAGEGGGLASARAEWAAGPLAGEPVEVRDRGRGRLEIAADGLPVGKHTLLLQAEDGEGGAASLRLPLWIGDRPGWEGRLIYSVMVDRFSAGDGTDLAEGDPGLRAGGTLAGVVRRLEDGYLSDLGVGAIWLSPLVDNPEGQFIGRDGRMYEGYHGYWPVAAPTLEAPAIEPALGTAEEVDALIEAAHARNIRVLFDVVPNHVHEDHPWRVQHAGEGWFHEDAGCICGDYTCPWSEDIGTCWFTPYLPDLAWEHPDARRAALDALRAQALRSDVDGFRVDAVPMIPRAATREIAWMLRQEIAGEGWAGAAAFHTVGETFTGADGGPDIAYTLGPHGISGAFDFPAMWALRGFLTGALTGEGLEDALAEGEARFAGSGALLSPMLGNHDTTRILSELAGQDLSDPWRSPPGLPVDAAPFARLQVGLALLFALPGAPVIWQGDEYGQPGANDPDNRRPLRSGAALADLQRATLEVTQRLGRARACSGALQRGRRTPMAAEGAAVAWVRDSGDEQAIIAANAGDTEQTLMMDLPAIAADRIVDILSGGEIAPPSGAWSLTLPPRSARLYLPVDVWASCGGEG